MTGETGKRPDPPFPGMPTEMIEVKKRCGMGPSGGVVACEIMVGEPGALGQWNFG